MFRLSLDNHENITLSLVLMSNYMTERNKMVHSFGMMMEMEEASSHNARKVQIYFKW